MQRNLNQRIKWLRDVESEGWLTEELVNRGKQLKLYKEVSYFRVDPKIEMVYFTNLGNLEEEDGVAYELKVNMALCNR